ncbi:MAG: hypothetical protein WDA68_09200 [Phycisphaerae bacterium]
MINNMKHIFKLQFLRFYLLLFLVLKHTLSCSSSDNNIDGSPNPSMPPSGEIVASFWVTNLDQSLLLQKQNTLSIDPKAHFDETITLD